MAANMIGTGTVGDICPVCKIYGPHETGSVRMPRPMDPDTLLEHPGRADATHPILWDWRTATCCKACGWTTIYQ